jgi:hypothetical protein
VGIKRWFAAETRAVLLCPSKDAIPQEFHNVDVSDSRHRSLLAELQAFRGRVYLRDGALDSSQLTADGRHKLDIDEQSWHVLALTETGEICGCTRTRQHRGNLSFSELWVRNAAVAFCPTWGRTFRAAVEGELQRARLRDMAFVELGGWAVSDERRQSADALRLALTTFALARRLGAGFGITTATVKHCSAAILRKIGGRPLEIDGLEVPSYYDPHYRCEMEVLRFEADPEPRYLPWVNEIEQQLDGLRIICRRGDRAFWPVPDYTSPGRELPLA